MKKNKKIKHIRSSKQNISKSNKFFPFCILVVLIVLGIIFIFLFKNSRGQSQLTEIQEIHFPPSNSENAEVSEKSKVKPEVVNLNNLRISNNLSNQATDKISNISIKYPEGWKTVSSKSSDQPLKIQSPDYVEPYRSPDNTEYSAFVEAGALLFFVKINNENKNLSLLDYIYGTNNYIEGSIKLLEKNNIEAAQYSYDMNYDSNKNYEVFDNLLILKNGEFYLIALAYRKFDEEKYKNLLTEIASTIEF